MPIEQIRLVAFWGALMLIYLLGDVLRIFSGDFKPGEIAGQPVSRSMWLLVAVIMLIPIAMVVLNLTVSHPAMRWANIVVSVFFVIFNIAGLPYPGAYDNFLIVVSFVVNALIVWQAWRWRP